MVAAPRKNPDDPKWAEIDAQKADAQPQGESTTERELAPDTVSAPVAVLEAPPPPAPVYYAPPQPRQMRVERQGARSEPYTRRFPQVRGGTCEYCGVLDRNTPAQYQYKLCPHYRGMQLACSYCPGTKDADEVIGHSTLNIAESPDNPAVLIVWCDSYSCSDAHNKRFQKNRS